MNDFLQFVTQISQKYQITFYSWKLEAIHENSRNKSEYEDSLTTASPHIWKIFKNQKPNPQISLKSKYTLTGREESDTVKQHRDKEENRDCKWDWRDIWNIEESCPQWSEIRGNCRRRWYREGRERWGSDELGLVRELGREDRMEMEIESDLVPLIDVCFFCRSGDKN